MNLDQESKTQTMPEPQTEPQPNPVDRMELHKRNMEIVDKYIMGEPIEKTLTIGGKLKVVIRAPHVDIVNAMQMEVANAGRDNSYVGLQVEASSTLLGAYIRSYNEKDFALEYKDEFDTIEGKKKIRAYLDATLLEPIRDKLAEEIFKFYQEIKDAFTDESLDFI